MRIGVMLRHLRDQKGGIGTLTRNLLAHLLSTDAANEYVLMYAHAELLGTYARHSHVTEVVAEAPSKLVWDQVVAPRVARRHHVDLIFNPKLSVPLLTSRPSVFVMAGGDWFVFPQNYKLHDRLYHRAFASLYCRAARAVISISHSATSDILRAMKVDPAKVRTIHLGVGDAFRRVENRETLATLRRKYSLPERFVLWVGQVYPMKNVARLLRAYAKLRTRLAHGLVLVGKPELKYERDLALIEELDLGRDVVRTGWVPDDDLPGLYSLADLFVLPSLYEGFGLPLLEAMACGCPVVTSGRGAMREVAGEAALFVDPTDVDGIADAMHECLTNTELRQRLTQKGLERARQFTWSRCARQSLDLFESLNDGAGGSRL